MKPNPSLSPSKEAGSNLFMSSIVGMANILAVIAAFFGTPPLYGKTVGVVQRYTGNYYGYEFIDLISFFWLVICALLIFFIARASVGTALVMGGLAIAARLLV